MNQPTEGALRDLSSLEAAYACEQFQQFAQRSRRSSTFSSLASETDTLWSSEPVYEIDGNALTAKEARKRQQKQEASSFRGSWFARIWTGIVLASALYSTAFSGLWFVLAVTSYQYNVGHSGNLTFSNLSTLIAAGAKTIELSFEIVSVAVLGQELTRRMTARGGNGINLAQMQLKAFLAQPGSMITNWQALFHVAPSMMGFVCLFIAAIGILYTTASDALVSPSTSMASMGIQVVPAQVQTAFVNSSNIMQSCPAQVSAAQDHRGLGACYDVEQAGWVFRTLVAYLREVEDAVSEKNPGSIMVANRTPPSAITDRVASVSGFWRYDHVNEPIAYAQDGRIVNNVTMLLPHAGVVGPATSFGKSLAEQDQNGPSTLAIKASVTTPTINVLCGSLAEDDPTIAAIVLSEWTAAQNASINMTEIVDEKDAIVRAGWYNGTAFDPFWKFTSQHRPPVFPNLPGPNNTRISWSRSTNGTAYLLSRAPDHSLFMCGFTAWLSHNCSTNYRTGQSGGVLSLDCRPDNEMAYKSTIAPASAQLGLVPALNAWTLSLGLGSSSDSNGSLARMLTQQWPSAGAWNVSKPSAAEMLAVMSSSLLLGGAMDAPLGDTDANGWVAGSSAGPSLTIKMQAFAEQQLGSTQTSLPRADAAQQTTFPAAVQLTVYSAGSNSNSQLGFFVVLMGAWFFNTLFLLYLIATLIARRRSTGEDLGADAEGAGTWTLRADLADPQALFGLALNSRPDERLADPALAPLPRKAMSQRWRVAGSKYRVYIHPIGPRPSPLRRALSSALTSTVGSLHRKSSGIQKEQITMVREVKSPLP